MKPFPDTVIEWIANLPDNYAFELNKKCYRCGQEKLICALTPAEHWMCGECWPTVFVWTDPIDR
jgi:ribosomal protein S27AE